MRNHGITNYHKSWNTNRQELIHPKDKVDLFKFTRLAVIVGETAMVPKPGLEEII